MKFKKEIMAVILSLAVVSVPIQSLAGRTGTFHFVGPFKTIENQISDLRSDLADLSEDIAHISNSIEALAEIDALIVQAEAAQGLATPGNRAPANFLILVTDPQTGAPITGLIDSEFTIINHFSVPGALCGFSNNITNFNDVGTGAYQVQVELVDIPECTWVEGDYLAQVIVRSGSRGGQTPLKLSIQ